MAKHEFWAWYDGKEDAYRYIYARKFQVEMCAPDGFKREIECGEGLIVRVRLTEIKEGL